MAISVARLSHLDATRACGDTKHTTEGADGGECSPAAALHPGGEGGLQAPFPW